MLRDTHKIEVGEQLRKASDVALWFWYAHSHTCTRLPTHTGTLLVEESGDRAEDSIGAPITRADCGSASPLFSQWVPEAKDAESSSCILKLSLWSFMFTAPIS